jgi:hypothetical protein
MLLDGVGCFGDLRFMTPIERAARALCALEARAGTGAVSPDDKADWRRHVPQVIAVIDALHEPGPSMKEAGAEIIRHISPDETLLAYQSDAANIWRYMIDAISRDGH